MKRFFYSHAEFTKACLPLIHLTPIVISITALFLQPGGISNAPAYLSMLLLLCGITVSLILTVCFHIPPLKYVEKTLDELERLRLGRICFFTSERQTRDSAAVRIRHNLEKAGLKPVDLPHGHPGRLGLWHRRRRAEQREIRLDPAKYRSDNYFLYSVPFLDKTEWNALYTDLCGLMLNRRTDMKRLEEKTDLVYAVCILADHIEPEIAQAMCKPQSFVLNEKITVRGVRVCAADVGQDHWYACAEKHAMMVRSNDSRRLLGKMTFGSHPDDFPYQGNTEFTTEYLALLEEASSMPLRECWNQYREREEKKRAEETDIREDRIFAGMQEGEIRLDGDILYCIDQKRRITASVYLPEETQRLIRENRENEDCGDLEDMLDEDAQDDSAPREPSFGPDYRGSVVVEIPTLCYAPVLRRISPSAQTRLCGQFRSYLLALGFESVSFWNINTDEITER